MVSGKVVSGGEDGGLLVVDNRLDEWSGHLVDNWGVDSHWGVDWNLLDDLSDGDLRHDLGDLWGDLSVSSDWGKDLLLGHEWLEITGLGSSDSDGWSSNGNLGWSGNNGSGLDDGSVGGGDGGWSGGNSDGWLVMSDDGWLMVSDKSWGSKSWDGWPDLNITQRYKTFCSLHSWD